MNLLNKAPGTSELGLSRPADSQAHAGRVLGRLQTQLSPTVASLPTAKPKQHTKLTNVHWVKRIMQFDIINFYL